MSSSDYSPMPDWKQAHALPVRVYYEDTDAGKVVYYANYLKFLERGRTEWLRSFGFSQEKLAQEHGILFVVASVHIDYRRPAVLDDLLFVETLASEIRKASLNFDQRVMRETTLLTVAKVNLVCVSSETLRPVPIPDVLKENFSQ